MILTTWLVHIGFVKIVQASCWGKNVYKINGVLAVTEQFCQAIYGNDWSKCLIDLADILTIVNHHDLLITSLGLQLGVLTTFTPDKMNKIIEHSGLQDDLKSTSKLIVSASKSFELYGYLVEPQAAFTMIFTGNVSGNKFDVIKSGSLCEANAMIVIGASNKGELIRNIIQSIYYMLGQSINVTRRRQLNNLMPYSSVQIPLDTKEKTNSLLLDTDYIIANHNTVKSSKIRKEVQTTFTKSYLRKLPTKEHLHDIQYDKILSRDRKSLLTSEDLDDILHLQEENDREALLLNTKRHITPTSDTIYSLDDTSDSFKLENRLEPRSLKIPLLTSLVEHSLTENRMLQTPIVCNILKSKLGVKACVIKIARPIPKFLINKGQIISSKRYIVPGKVDLGSQAPKIKVKDPANARTGRSVQVEPETIENIMDDDIDVSSLNYGKSSLSTGLILGIAGGILFFGALIILIIVLFRRSKSKPNALSYDGTLQGRYKSSLGEATIVDRAIKRVPGSDIYTDSTNIGHKNGPQRKKSITQQKGHRNKSTHGTRKGKEPDIKRSRRRSVQKKRAPKTR